MSEIKVNKKVLKQSQGIWKMRKDEAGKKEPMPFLQRSRNQVELAVRDGGLLKLSLGPEPWGSYVIPFQECHLKYQATRSD